MSEFINTIEVLGDDAVVDSIIERTITEFKDNMLTEVGDYAFYGCAALETVDLPNVTEIMANAFHGCKSLESMGFPSVTIIQANVFEGCSALAVVDLPVVTAINYTSVFANCSNLATLIIRTGSVAKLNNANSLTGTPIASGTGYIYVPKALVGNYKAATNWSTYAAQFRALEDWTVDGTVTGELALPEEISDDWDTIMASVADGTYRNKYKVRDYKALDLGTEGVITMQIAAFDTDDLADGSGKASITWTAKELLVTPVVRPAGTTNSKRNWSGSVLRSYLTDTVRALIPAEVSNCIKSVNKISFTIGMDSETSADEIWVPSFKEVESYALDRVKCIAGTETAGPWWLRDTHYTDTQTTVAYGAYVQEDGQLVSNKDSSKATTLKCHICLCFCT